jgi:hypothetical protein
MVTDEARPAGDLLGERASTGLEWQEQQQYRRVQNIMIMTKLSMMMLQKHTNALCKRSLRQEGNDAAGTLKFSLLHRDRQTLALLQHFGLI